MEFSFTPRTIVKKVAGHSTRFLIATAVSAVIVEPDRKRDKARVFIGTYALAGMVSDKVTEWVDTEIDEWIEAYHDFRGVFEEIKAEEQSEATVHVITEVGD